MRPVLRRQRPPAASRDAIEASAQLRWLAERRDWAVHAGCDGCGGYWMALQVPDVAQRELAEARARAFLARVHTRNGCLACEARRWRDEPPPSSTEPHAWWDPDLGDWVAWRPVEGMPQGLSIPLGIGTFWSPQEVRAAARALWSSDRMPLRVASEPAAVDPDCSTIYYEVASGRWNLHVSCFDCGGFALRLTSFGRGAVEAGCDEALTCLDLVAREGCPSCRTRRERDRRGDHDEEPRLWFDTDARDWLLWQPLDGSAEGVTVPLGIGRFDARRALVYRAAARLLFDSQLFPDGEQL